MTHNWSQNFLMQQSLRELHDNLTAEMPMRRSESLAMPTAYEEAKLWAVIRSRMLNSRKSFRRSNQTTHKILNYIQLVLNTSKRFNFWHKSSTVSIMNHKFTEHGSILGILRTSWAINTVLVLLGIILSAMQDIISL